MILQKPIGRLALAVGLAFLSAHVSWSQSPDQPLPNGISAWEMEHWLAHPLDLTNPTSLRGIPTPPPGSNLRTAAEWEEIEVLTITWQDFPCILKQITAASVEECRVVIFSENVNQTTNYLTGNACGGPVPMDSVEIVSAASNSIWIRDYGANTVYTEYNDGRVLVDWLYNRPRPDDDAIPDVLADHMGRPLQHHRITRRPHEHRGELDERRLRNGLCFRTHLGRKHGRLDVVDQLPQPHGI